MPDINLIPWRQAARQARRGRFFSALVVAVVCAVGVAAVQHVVRGRAIARQVARNHYLAQERDQVAAHLAELRRAQGQRTGLLAQIDMIRDLQAARLDAVRFLDALVRVVPAGVTVTAVDYRDRQKIVVSGVALSDVQVAQMMKRLAHSPVLSDPVLKEISRDRHAPDTAGIRFQLGLKQR